MNTKSEFLDILYIIDSSGISHVLSRYVFNMLNVDIVYKTFIALIVLTFFLPNLVYAEPVNVIEIRYEVYVENTDSLNSYKYNLPYEAFHVVSPNKVLTLNKYAADLDEVHLYNLDDLLDYRCYIKEEGEESIAVKTPLQLIPTLVTNNNDETRYQVAGMICKKYEILHKNTKVEIYTTDSFGVDFTPFSQLGGYAMQYTFVDDVYGRVTYAAKSIFPTIVDESVLSVDKYKITEELFPEDVRTSLDEEIVANESSSLFKLNKKKISYKFKLHNKIKINEQSNQDSMVVFAIGGNQKYGPFELELLSSLLDFSANKKVKFYHFTYRGTYTKKESQELQALGINAANLSDFLVSKLKVKYYPTYILLDKNRRVVKYKIGTSSDMLASFTEKIMDLSKDDN